jgi:hypothetical protein
MSVSLRRDDEYVTAQRRREISIENLKLKLYKLSFYRLN